MSEQAGATFNGTDTEQLSPSPGMALVIGNSRYGPGLLLKNPANDAKLITEQLEEIGFDVQHETDLEGYRFGRVFSQFCTKLEQAAAGGREVVGVVYFAGHGVQVKGENYLLPTDGKIVREFDLQQQAVQLGLVLEAMGRVTKTAVILLDCCRNNPLRLVDTAQTADRSLTSTAGLAAAKFKAKGVYIAFATAPDSVAADGQGDNSPFASALADHIKARDKSIFDVMIGVRNKVVRLTDGTQIPWDQHSLFNNFGFNTSSKLGIAGSPRQRSN